MATSGKSKSPRGGTVGKNKMTPSSKAAAPQRSPQKLDDVSDAPESGEPREQGRSRGRVIDAGQTGGARRSGQAGTASTRAPARKPASRDPRAAAERDESGNTRNEAWESGRQKAME